MIGMREPIGGDNVRDNKRARIRDIPLPVVKKNSVGGAKGQRGVSEKDEQQEDKRCSHSNTFQERKEYDERMQGERGLRKGEKL